jgi:hypothetical protein
MADIIQPIPKQPPRLSQMGEKPVEKKPSRLPTINTGSTVTSIKEFLRPFGDELRDEWYGLLKMLHIYDHKKEEKYLDDYRRLRGWK